VTQADLEYEGSLAPDRLHPRLAGEVLPRHLEEVVRHSSRVSKPKQLLANRIMRTSVRHTGVASVDVTDALYPWREMTQVCPTDARKELEVSASVHSQAAPASRFPDRADGRLGLADSSIG
jgi:hypothetical protein